MPTKKQLTAMLEVIATGQRIKDHKWEAENERRKKRSQPPLPRPVWGERKTPTGCMITDGYAGLCYAEPIPELPHEGEYEQDHTLIRGLIEKEFTHGNYALVSSPFAGTIRASGIRELLRTYAYQRENDSGRTRIELRSGENGASANFDALYVRRAVEAMGGTVRLYIGSSSTSNGGNYLLLTPDDGDGIVLPIRPGC